jgi:hypothetical protein
MNLPTEPASGERSALDLDQLTSVLRDVAARAIARP